MPGAYDVLYAARDNRILWGESSGRLVRAIEQYCSGDVVLDAGCGDGKNALYLEKQGYSVTGFDVSPFAIEGLYNRFRRAGFTPKGSYRVLDIEREKILGSYDVLLSYGLFHCLRPKSRADVHRKLQRLVKPGGVCLFTCLLDKILLPERHSTPGVTLAGHDEVVALFHGWDILTCQYGIIEEQHPPTIGLHRHSAVWIAARRCLQRT